MEALLAISMFVLLGVVCYVLSLKHAHDGEAPSRTVGKK